MADKRYYWLKLPKDFFKRHDIKIIKAMPNGKDYVLFYLTLLLESLTHDGQLRFSKTIPYNEDMLSVITDTNIDIVRSALKILQELHMVEILDDQTIYMTEVDKMLGGESWSAEKMRRFREKQSVTLESLPVTCDVELELEKDIDTTRKKQSPCFDHAHKAYKCAAYLDGKIRELMPNKKATEESTLQKWADAFDKTNRINGYEWELIGEVLEFSQEDDFWKTNILSGDKFRKQFEQLYAKMRGKK